MTGGPAPVERQLPVVHAAQLEQRSAVQRWLIENLWADSAVGLIGGHPKSCKTWLGLEMAVSVGSGTDCLDRFHVPRPGLVLLYLAEDALHIVRERLAALCQHRHTSIDQLNVWVITASTLRLDRPEDVALLEQTVAAYKPRLLLLDPFVRMHRQDENSAQDVAGILDRLRKIQRAHNTAVAVVHHTRKNGNNADRGHALRGSSELWAWGDSNLYLTTRKELLRLTIEHRAAPAPKPIHLLLETDPPHLVVTQAEQENLAGLQDRILDVLTRSGQPVTRTELRRRLAVNNKRLGDVLKELEENGSVQRTLHGWQR